MCHVYLPQVASAWSNALSDADVQCRACVLKKIFLSQPAHKLQTAADLVLLQGIVSGVVGGSEISEFLCGFFLQRAYIQLSSTYVSCNRQCNEIIDLR